MDNNELAYTAGIIDGEGSNGGRPDAIDSLDNQLDPIEEAANASPVL